MVKVATNEQYLFAFNEYLQTNNLTQAVTDGYILAGQQVVPINFDMFFGFLCDKIVLSVINSHSFIDKLDGLYNGTLDVGGIIEDKLTILKSKNYEYDTKNFETDVENPYKKDKKGLSVVFHKITDYKKIQVTVSYAQLKTGCLTENGVDAIVNNMINDVQVEYSAWAYDQKKKALSQEGYVQVITFTDYADFNIKLKDVKIDVTNYDNSYKHNASLLFTPTSQSNLVIIMSERFKNKVDINVFTGLFNVSYAELKDNILYIDEFDDPQIVCGIYDKRGFQFRKVLDTSKELENGADLSRNRWLHFWRMHSVSPHYTAVVFKEADNSDSYDDVYMLTKGYDNNNYTTSISINAPFAGTYSIDKAEPVDCTKNQAITITNPQRISPVVIKFVETGTGKTCNYRVRFEYPANIDATLGKKRIGM